MSKSHLDILTELKGEGIKPQDPRYNLKLLQKMVETCKENRKVYSCEECALLLNCEKRAGYLREVRYGAQRTSVAEDFSV